MGHYPYYSHSSCLIEIWHFLLPECLELWASLPATIAAAETFWTRPGPASLWEACVRSASCGSDLYPLSAPKKPDQEHLNRMCNFRGNSRGSRYSRACSGSSGRVGTSHRVTGRWRRLGCSLCSRSPARGRGWHCAARL